jgi:hypothetical protein
MHQRLDDAHLHLQAPWNTPETSFFLDEGASPQPLHQLMHTASFINESIQNTKDSTSLITFKDQLKWLHESANKKYGTQALYAFGNLLRCT